MATIEGRDRFVPPGRYEDLLDVLKGRRAVRGFEDRDVEEEKITKILEAGRWAPSGANLQPWEYLVVRDSDTIRRIGDIFVQYYDDAQSVESPDFPVDNKRWMRSPPVYIVVLGDERVKSGYTDTEVNRIEIDYLGYDESKTTNVIREEVFDHSLASTIYAMWLAAASLGLGTTSATVGIPKAEEIRTLLDVPDVYRIPALLPIGYPLKYQSTRYRRPLSEFVHRESFDQSKFREDAEKWRWIERIRASRYRGDGRLNSTETADSDYVPADMGEWRKP